MWLLIIVGLILLLPLISNIVGWILAIGFAIIILGWFFHALLWLLPFIAVAFVGQKLIDSHYLKTGKGKFWASHKAKDK